MNIPRLTWRAWLCAVVIVATSVSLVLAIVNHESLPWWLAALHVSVPILFTVAFCEQLWRRPNG